MVIALGMKSNGLYEEVKSLEYEYKGIPIGDCLEPREILKTVCEGYFVANKI